MTADYKKVPVQEHFQLHIHSAKTLYPAISPLKLTRRSATRSQRFLQVLPGTVQSTVPGTRTACTHVRGTLYRTKYQYWYGTVRYLVDES